LVIKYHHVSGADVPGQREHADEGLPVWVLVHPKAGHSWPCASVYVKEKIQVPSK